MTRLTLPAVICSLTLLISCATSVPPTPLAIQSYNLGNALSRLGESREAERSFKAALNESPDYFKAAYNLSLLYDRLERFDEALQVIEPFSDREGVPELQAYLLARSGEADAALLAYDRLIEETGEHSWNLEKAKILLSLEQYREAEKLLRELLDTGNTEAELFYLLGERERLAGEGNGIDWYAAALLADPGYERALEQVLIHYDTEEADRALRRELESLLGKAAAQHPDHGELLFLRGRNLLLLGEKEGLEYIEDAHAAGFSEQSRLVGLYDRLASDELDVSGAYLELLQRLDIVRVK